MRRWLAGESSSWCVVAALGVGAGIVRRDDAGERRRPTAPPAPEVDGNGCSLGVYANTDFRLDSGTTAVT